jgi:hypothetical protein
MDVHPQQHGIYTYIYTHLYPAGGHSNGANKMFWQDGISCKHLTYHNVLIQHCDFPQQSVKFAEGIWMYLVSCQKITNEQKNVRFHQMRCCLVARGYRIGLGHKGAPQDQSVLP